MGITKQRAAKRCSGCGRPVRRPHADECGVVKPEHRAGNVDSDRGPTFGESALNAVRK